MGHALDPQNIPLNRDQNSICYDENRVVLSMSSDKSKSYINASLASGNYSLKKVLVENGLLTHFCRTKLSLSLKN